MGSRSVRTGARAYVDHAPWRVRALRICRRGPSRVVRRLLEHAVARVRVADVSDPGDRSGPGFEPTRSTDRPRRRALAEANPRGRWLGGAHRLRDGSHSVGPRGGGCGVCGSRDRPQRCGGRETDGRPGARRGRVHGARGLARRPQWFSSVEGGRIRAVHAGHDAGNRGQRNALLLTERRRQRRLARLVTAHVRCARAQRGFRSRDSVHRRYRSAASEAVVSRTSRRRRGDASRALQLVSR